MDRYYNTYEFVLMCLVTKISFYLVEKNKGSTRGFDSSLNEIEILNCLVVAVDDIVVLTDTEDIIKEYRDAQAIAHGRILIYMSDKDLVDFYELKKYLGVNGL